MAGVWSEAWGQELKAEVGVRVQGVGAWGRGRGKNWRAGCRGRERGQLMGQGGGALGRSQGARTRGKCRQQGPLGGLGRSRGQAQGQGQPALALEGAPPPALKS